MLSRRTFIWLGAGGVLVSAAVFRREIVERLRGGGARAASTLARTGLDGAQARMIGSHFLVAHPADHSVDRLSTALRAANREDWAAMIRADYEAGRTFTVDGWTLSMTEGRLCALYALSTP